MLSEVYSRLSLFHVHVLDASDAVRNLDWAIVHWEVLNRYDPILLMMCFSPMPITMVNTWHWSASM